MQGTEPACALRLAIFEELAKGDRMALGMALKRSLADVVAVLKKTKGGKFVLAASMADGTPMKIVLLHKCRHAPTTFTVCQSMTGRSTGGSGAGVAPFRAPFTLTSMHD